VKERLDEQIRALVREQLADEERDRCVERAVDVMQHSLVGLGPHETIRIDDGRDHAYVFVADRLELQVDLSDLGAGGG